MNKSLILLICLSLMMLVACGNKEQVNTNENNLINNTGMMYLYGEIHGKEIIHKKEIELWKQYYNEDGMRHLFIEASYPKAQLLNIWMSEDNDDILNEVITTDFNPEAIKNFYRIIKKECPETIFHGTDIGKGYTSHGVTYRNYLEDNDLVDTEMYQLNEEAIKQEKHFIATRDDSYREKMLVENFIREFNKLKDENIMGIYGAAHISMEEITMESHTFDSMGKQLRELYGGRITLVDLPSELLNALLDEPIKVEQMEVAGKEYKAECFGKDEYTNSNVITAYEFWRLEDAYEDFKNSKLTGKEVHAYSYPMEIEENQVYVIVLLLKDNTTMKMYTRSDGDIEDGLFITKEFLIND
ncbi:hypothetical protein [Alkaliphilus serpentinus]|uniref:Erythromycin esterase n=1 Tax=Alkaliphilus serpentinus TaxID=1482731 RepID=A0A833HL66_9FIRM|nr:hypothetical protein [Alkaliphilus serpentinus]KAB3525443.1 hypothetical protein F8153_15255 [Alkaliphilus serpentinus]